MTKIRIDATNPSTIMAHGFVRTVDGEQGVVGLGAITEDTLDGRIAGVSEAIRNMDAAARMKQDSAGERRRAR